MAEILDDYTPYTDEYGLIQNNAIGLLTGNGIRYTAEFVLALHIHHALEPIEKTRIALVLDACFRLPGLLNRVPNANTWQEGPDDYVAMATAGVFLNTNFAGLILNYGRNNGFVFNNINPGKFTFSSWLGRQRGLVTHWEFCAGESPGVIGQLFWGGGILLTLISPSQDGFVLSWFQLIVAKDKNWMTKLIYRLWKWRLLKKYPNGIGGVLREYYGAMHPSSKWLDNIS